MTTSPFLEADMTPEATPSTSGDPTGVPSDDVTAKTAQDRLTTITSFVDSARASAAAAADHQAQVAAVLADVQAKLAEITATATQASTAKTQTATEQAAIVESVKATLAEAQSKLAEVTSAATQAVVAKTAITDDQAVIATKSDHIQKAQEHADKVRADLDRTLTAVTQQATDAEGLKARVQAAADNTATLLTDVRTTKGTAETEAAAIATARQAAEESATVTKSLADKSAVVESRIADYEKRLAEVETQGAEQLKTIESLLPGATGAGLAHAFNERRKGFLKPHDRWQWVFVGSVLVIVALAGSGLWHVYHLQTFPTYEELLRLWLARLPVAGALLWLALHASRESALAKRLEEDYGYKAAVASCLEGFQKQMSQFGKDVEANSPLARLLNNTLTTIAAPPGRIYDKHQLVVSPINELKEATKTVVEAAKTLKPLG
jgi:hypothetical protein